MAIPIVPPLFRQAGDDEGLVVAAGEGDDFGLFELERFAPWRDVDVHAAGEVLPRDEEQVEGVPEFSDILIPAVPDPQLGGYAFHVDWRCQRVLHLVFAKDKEGAAHVYWVLR